MIKIWNIEEATCEQTLLGHTRAANALVELPNDILISGGKDQIRFWNLKSTNDDSACTRILPNKGFCFSIILLSNEEMACASGENINIFDIYEGKIPLKKLTGHREGIRDLLLHSDRPRLLTSSQDETMIILIVHTGICIRTFKGNSGADMMVWFNEKVIATAYRNGDIKLWNVNTGECVRTLLKGKHGLTARSVVDKDGVLISCGSGNILSFWSN